MPRKAMPHRNDGRAMTIEKPAPPARFSSHRRLRALLLALPLLVFIAATFLAPIAAVLTRSVTDPETAALLPRTEQALRAWDGAGLPLNEMVGVFLSELATVQKERRAAILSKRLASVMPDLRKPLMAAAKASADGALAPEDLMEQNPLWRETGSWNAVAQISQYYTDRYLLQTLDLKRNLNGDIVSVPANERIFVDALARTFGISIAVTLITLVLAYPLAYFINRQSAGWRQFLLLFILLPFWTSVLVRTAAWLVLLQTHGVVNDTLLALNVISQPMQLIFSRSGTMLAMIHIQLPFTFLPIYSVMKTISPSYVRAARSLGATPSVAFWRIYVPLSLPGAAAGCLLTFILCLGYYITPAILGGPSDQMLSYYVAYYLNQEINWSMAAAVSAVLLAITMVFYITYSRLIDPVQQAAR